MLLKKKNSVKNFTWYEKKCPDKRVHLKKIYKFTSEHFLIGHVVFVLIVKNVIKNEKFHFAPNLCEKRKKWWEIKCLSQKDLQIFIQCKCTNRALSASIMIRMRSLRSLEPEVNRIYFLIWNQKQIYFFISYWKI